MSTIEFEGVNLRGTPSEFLHRILSGLRQPGVGAALLTIDESGPVIKVEFLPAVQAAPAPEPAPVEVNSGPVASLGKVSGRGEVRDPEPPTKS